MESEKIRGTFLASMLIVYVGIFTVTLYEFLKSLYLSIVYVNAVFLFSSFDFYLLLVILLIGIAGLFGLFVWRKWGLYLLTLATLMFLMTPLLYPTDYSYLSIEYIIAFLALVFMRGAVFRKRDLFN